MPLRNVVRAPRRTIMTMLGLAAVITTVVSLSGMFDSFAATVDGIEHETLHQGANRLDVRLDGFHARTLTGGARRSSARPRSAQPSPSLRVEGELRSRRAVDRRLLASATPRSRDLDADRRAGRLPAGRAAAS